jgi:SNF2 family DNA or RNA helicase
MEVLNPGLLGTRAAFKQAFFVPIQTLRDAEAARRLRRITGPFVLRRLKTDRSVISDLPEKVETKDYCMLTPEQASLYQAVLDDLEEALQGADDDGIQRKGVILATLTRLKQVCNHPAHFLGDGSRIAGRSGKVERLVERLDELVAAGDRALVFTQFTAMGDILRTHLQGTFGLEVPFLHGGVSRARREELVDRFQAGRGPGVFLLSLKAGGTGLNLTAANHVFLFDRWWNPAVESQAADRAYRIGQRRNVQVHFFVCAGTVEDRIDEIVEGKRELAGRVVGAGEGWLTGLSNRELREVLALRPDAALGSGAGAGEHEPAFARTRG